LLNTHVGVRGHPGAAGDPEQFPSVNEPEEAAEATNIIWISGGKSITYEFGGIKQCMGTFFQMQKRHFK